jgi:hypothetical protein
MHIPAAPPIMPGIEVGAMEESMLPPIIDIERGIIIALFIFQLLSVSPTRAVRGTAPTLRASLWGFPVSYADLCAENSLPDLGSDELSGIIKDHENLRKSFIANALI